MSEVQIRTIGAAVQKFTSENGRRPETLEALVQAGAVQAGDLLDAARARAPGIDAKAGRSAENPDVIYFPALRPSDPNDLVLLCTLLLHSEGDSYRVIFNDGRYAALKAHDLVQALNRTYSYISSQVRSAGSGVAATRGPR